MFVVDVVNRIVRGDSPLPPSPRLEKDRALASERANERAGERANEPAEIINLFASLKF